MPLFPPPDSRSPYRYRHLGTGAGTSGPTVSRYQIAGMTSNNAGMTSSFGPVVGQSVAVPFYTGPASMIESVHLRVVTGTGASSLHVSFYTNTSDSVLYPTSLLGYTSDIATTSSGTIVGVTGQSIAVPSESLIWPVLQASHAIAVTGLVAASQWPILGANIDSTNYPYLGSAWLGSGTYGTPPSTFQTDAVPNLSASIPAIYLRCT